MAVVVVMDSGDSGGGKQVVGSPGRGSGLEIV